MKPTADGFIADETSANNRRSPAVIGISLVARGALPEPGKPSQKDAMYIVEIRREQADVAAQMAAIREWLDAQRFEPDEFRYDSASDGAIFRLVFKNETEARACAHSFGGQVSRKA